MHADSDAVLDPDDDAEVDAGPLLVLDGELDPLALDELPWELDPPPSPPPSTALAKSVVPQCTTAAPAMNATTAEPTRRPSFMRAPRFVPR
jgi:hypothetical protein